MIGMKGGQFLFDTKEIFEQLTKAERRVFSKFGAYVMTTARGLMRKPNKKGDASKPGEPPKTRLGHVKKGAFAIRFAWDTQTRSLVVGPLIFPGSKKRTDGASNVDTLEHGGTIKYPEAQKGDGSWSFHAALWAKVNHSPTREATGAFGARPFMQPAYDKNIDKLSGMWKDAISK